MTKYVIVRLFLRFLKKRKAYHAFLSNFNSYKGKRFRGKYEETMNEYLNRVGGVYLISRAFSWSDNEEGFSYWEDLHNQWFKIIEKKRLSDESIYC